MGSFLRKGAWERNFQHPMCSFAAITDSSAFIISQFWRGEGPRHDPSALPARLYRVYSQDIASSYISQIHDPFVLIRVPRGNRWHVLLG